MDQDGRCGQNRRHAARAIETRQGLSTETKRRMLAAVHAALMATFKIPDDDRGQRLIEGGGLTDFAGRGVQPDAARASEGCRQSRRRQLEET